MVNTTFTQITIHFRDEAHLKMFFSCVLPTNNSTNSLTVIVHGAAKFQTGRLGESSGGTRSDDLPTKNKLINRKIE